jgi:hypothetical protein
MSDEVRAPTQSSADGAEAESEITITNEFTSVRLRKVRTRNGERVEIRSLRVPNVVRLDALVLESLTWRSMKDIAKGLESPFGSNPVVESDEDA